MHQIWRQYDDKTAWLILFNFVIYSYLYMTEDG